MILRIFAVSVAALAVGSFVEHARAGQFFVCEDGAAIEIEMSRLEQAKRTIPCVAKHYGLEIQTEPKHESQARPKVEVTKSEPVNTEAAPLSRARSTTAASPSDVMIPERKPAPPKLRETDTKPVPSGLGGTRLIAGAANTDMKRVRIINAPPGGSKWFHVKH